MSNSITYILSIFLLLSAAILSAQSGGDLIERGKTYFQKDQLDSAKWVYQQAFQNENPDIQLKAIGGLISVAITKSEMSLADSLVSQGNQLVATNNIAIATLCEFKIKKGEFYRYNSLFQQALQEQREAVQLSKDLSDEPLIYANALYYAALTLERLGSFDSSLVYITGAYEIYKENLDTTSLKFANIYNGMGNTYYRLNQFDKAKEYYLKSKTIAEDRLGPVSSDLAIALGNLSSISRAEENYEQAVDYSTQALKIHRILDNEAGVASDYYALGVYFYFMGDYGRTKDYMEACIALREKLYNETHYSLIGPYQVLGIALEEDGDYESTLKYLKKTRPIIEANFGENSFDGAYNFENTALCYQSLSKIDSALYYIQLANVIQLSLSKEGSYSLGVHYFNYANTLYLANDLKGAEARAQQSEEIYLNLGMGNSSEYAQILVLYGKIRAEQGKWKEADQWFLKALNIVRVSDKDEAPNLSFQLTPNALKLINEYSNYLYQKYQETKNSQALKDFETYTDIYLDHSDRFRRQFIDPYTKSILIKNNTEVYNGKVGIYNQLFRESGDTRYLEAAYRFSEYGRASLLRDIQDEKIKSYAGFPDSLLQKEMAIKKEVAQLNQQMLENPDSEEVKKDLFTAKENLNSFIDQISDNYPNYYELKFNNTIASLSEVQSYLAPDVQLIEYMQDDTAYYALCINKSKTGLLYLGNKASIDEQIQEWKTSIIDQEEDRFKKAGSFLHQILWQPLEPYLDGSQVKIVPCGPLFYLNFETLPTDSGKYLIETYNITYGLSFHVLLSENDDRQSQVLVAVAPGFEDEIKQQYQAKLDTLETPDEEFLRTVRQPWSLKLVNHLKNKFAPLTFTGTGATESNIKANIQKGKVLYFGTHAIANASDPLRSKLVLAKEMGAQKEDGYLHAYEFFGLPLEAELALLNACESGLGNLQTGEGMISLAYSLHYAGCPSTVMSLWKVDEKISTSISQDFIDYLNEGYSKSKALRQAKLDYLETASPALQHPFYWGGMVLMGKDGTVELKGKSNFGYYVLGLALLGVIIIIGRRTYKFRYLKT
ncbi:MAG: CHAT domain-containing tetratricopeptide repeat protein [Bacteroidota bacterium]